MTGKVQYDGGSTYEGEWKAGKKDGRGNVQFPAGFEFMDFFNIVKIGFLCGRHLPVARRGYL